MLSYIYREVNGTGDILSQWSHKKDIIQKFYTPHQLVGVIKGSYILEKLGMQNFRRKKHIRIKEPP